MCILLILVFCTIVGIAKFCISDTFCHTALCFLNPPSVLRPCFSSPHLPLTASPSLSLPSVLSPACPEPGRRVLSLQSSVLCLLSPYLPLSGSPRPSLPSPHLPLIDLHCEASCEVGFSPSFPSVPCFLICVNPSAIGFA